MLGYDNLISDLLLNLSLSVLINIQYHHIALTSITHALEWMFLAFLDLLIESNDAD